MANAITCLRICLRIICSAALLFCPALSAPFYALYIIAGASVMIDGTIARKTVTVSELDSKLYTAADFVFVAVCLLKLLPALDAEAWMLIWTGIVALIKVTSIVFGGAVQNKLVAVHSVMNRITGALLFALPLTVGIIDSAGVVLLAATVAAVQECIL